MLTAYLQVYNKMAAVDQAGKTSRLPTEREDIANIIDTA